MGVQPCPAKRAGRSAALALTAWDAWRLALLKNDRLAIAFFLEGPDEKRKRKRK
jgi:hypothetical protein